MITPVNPRCLLSAGGLYIDSAYYQPQTIATPIIIHLGPQDLFWPRLRGSPDLLFNPSPLLNSAGASQLLRRRSPPGLLPPLETRQQYWKQYGGENEPRGDRHAVRSRSADETLFGPARSQNNVNKTQSNTSAAFGTPLQTHHQHRHIHYDVTSCMYIYLLSVHMDVCEF